MTFAQRTLINKGVFAALRRFPIAGHGLHSFNQVYPRYRIVGGDYPMNAHNEFIHSMIETGFLSAAILALTTLFLLKTAWLCRTGHTHQALFTAVFVSLLVQNLSGFSSRILPTSLLIPLRLRASLRRISGRKRSSSKVLHNSRQHRAVACRNVLVSAQSVCGSRQSFQKQTDCSLRQPGRSSQPA